MRYAFCLLFLVLITGVAAADWSWLPPVPGSSGAASASTSVAAGDQTSTQGTVPSAANTVAPSTGVAALQQGVLGQSIITGTPSQPIVLSCPAVPACPATACPAVSCPQLSVPEPSKTPYVILGLVFAALIFAIIYLGGEVNRVRREVAGAHASRAPVITNADTQSRAQYHERDIANLSAYVSALRTHGISETEARRILLEAGWDEQAIRMAGVGAVEWHHTELPKPSVPHGHHAAPHGQDWHMRAKNLIDTIEDEKPR